MLVDQHKFYIADVKYAYLGLKLLENIGADLLLTKGVIKLTNGTEIPLEYDDSQEKFSVLSNISVDDVEFLTDGVPDDELHNSTSICTDEIRRELNCYLDSKSKLFNGIGYTNLVEHHIKTSDDLPVNLPSYRLPVHLKQKAEAVISDYLEKGLISYSKNGYILAL